jgi:hypothetical protein
VIGKPKFDPKKFACKLVVGEADRVGIYVVGPVHTVSYKLGNGWRWFLSDDCAAPHCHAMMLTIIRGGFIVVDGDYTYNAMSALVDDLVGLDTTRLPRVAVPPKHWSSPSTIIELETARYIRQWPGFDLIGTTGTARKARQEIAKYYSKM